MRVSRVLAMLFGLLPGVAQAQSENPSQSPPENITVTAPGVPPEGALHDFIKSYTASSQPSGKITRWRMGACPITAGLSPAGNRLVTDRVRQLAALAGAPLGDAHCKPNIDIAFTLKPQVLLDTVREKNRVLLGYHTNSQEEALATVTHPVQAWYTTQTVDLNGVAYLDKGQPNAPGYEIQTPFGPVWLQDVPAVHVTGNHLNDGLSSELFHVIVVIDLAKVKGHTLGALSDYAAMLSLSRTQSFENCEPVASITNLVSAPCDGALKTNELNANDLAYLHGVYSLNPRNSFQQQKDEIAYAMKKGAGER